MTRKSSKVEPSVFRFICLREKSVANYHVDFTSKEDALDYIDKLNDSKIEWYGLYEINPKSDYLKAIVNKRIIPYNDLIPIDYVIQSSKKDTSKKKPVRKTKRKSV